MDHSLSNVLLVLMRLDVNDSHPLHVRGSRQGEDLPLLDEGKSYHLLAGVLDPTHRSTSAPVTGIELTGRKLKTYNRVVRDFQKISKNNSNYLLDQKLENSSFKMILN